jgi:hypothetical protein
MTRLFRKSYWKSLDSTYKKRAPNIFASACKVLNWVLLVIWVSFFFYVHVYFFFFFFFYFCFFFFFFSKNLKTVLIWLVFTICFCLLWLNGTDHACRDIFIDINAMNMQVLTKPVRLDLILKPLLRHSRKVSVATFNFLYFFHIIIIIVNLYRHAVLETSFFLVAIGI